MIGTLSEARSFVENAFINSPYIQSRSFPISSGKYFPEEIEYWAKKIVNSKWSTTLFTNEFNKTYSRNNKTSLTTLKYNDYVGQTFYIEQSSYPNGMFLTKISLYMYTKDITAPITLDVRPLINGIPSDTPIPMSTVVFDPTKILFATDPTKPWESIPNNEYLLEPNASPRDFFTDFVFDFPLYLKPGNYCFTVKSNSSKYNLYIAEIGKAEISTGAIISSPYIGNMISSQQGVSWNVDQTKDLCFTISRAIFELGDRDLQIQTGSANFNFDTLSLTTKSLEIGEVASISNLTSTVTDYNTLVNSTISIKENANIKVPSLSTSNTANGVVFNVTMSNTDDTVSPILDLHKTGVALVKNYIDPFDQIISDSELGNNGLALAKYYTKQVTLNDGFDADGLTVYIDVNRPLGTSIEVFYKILNKYDYSVEFSDASWVRMDKIYTTPTTNVTDYVEDTYQNLNIAYTGLNGVNYNSFKYFAIKVVFYSDDSTLVPTIKNFRAIATV